MAANFLVRRKNPKPPKLSTTFGGTLLFPLRLIQDHEAEQSKSEGKTKQDIEPIHFEHR